jgi:DTW domain-containing protein YfiP
MMKTLLSASTCTRALQGVLLGYNALATHSFASLQEGYYRLHVKEAVVQQDRTLPLDEFIGAIDHQNNIDRKKRTSSKPGDLQYSLLGSDTLATLIVRPRDNGWSLIRNLHVTRTLRRRGFALELLQLTLSDLKKGKGDSAVTGAYCFADSSLSELYLKAGFRNSLDGLPKTVLEHYKKLKGRQMDIECFQWSPLHLILLQHTKEVTRKTGTGSLLFDTQYLHVHNHTWSGRADNEIVSKALVEYDNPVLLWTGGSSNISHYPANNSTFVLLDGTWQEAQSMFRKIPFLQQLPRLSLEASAVSNYTLRQDFGWKARFVANENDTLLCTAEVAAELLDQSGNPAGGSFVRERLQDFQERN